MMTHSPKGHHNKFTRGFTLIELAVSLVILGLVVGLSTAVVRMTILSLDKGKKLSQGVWDVESAQNLLRNTFQKIPVGANIATSGVIFDFIGYSNTIDCYSSLPRSYREREPMRIQIFSENTANGMKNLIMSWPLSGEKGGTRNLIVLKDIKGCNFRYYGVAESGSSQWFDFWNREMVFPKLISVSCDFLHGDLRQWPELVVELPINSDPKQ